MLTWCSELTGSRDAKRPSRPGGDPVGGTITRLGGSEINNVKELIKVMNAHNDGDVVDMELIREGQRITGQTTLEKAPSAQPPQSMR
ncbi:MAG: hypothetical protein MUO70_01795 [Euryarchaeota archaeon]|nr:hypothetical protein [Euryarchaeota archaeon]